MTRSHRFRQQQIRRRVFLPFSMALLGLLGAACFAVHWQRSQCVGDKLETRLAIVTQLFQAGLEEDVELMQGLVDFLERDPGIREAWLARDRRKLLESALPQFEETCSKYQVTHFYFHDLERACFLRVHNPPQFGDTIDRHTLAQAARTGGTTWGLELGPFGTFTLRVVRPWRIDGRWVGHIELGKGIEHLPIKLKKALGAEFFFAVDKSRLQRTSWEEGLSMTGQTGNWDLVEDYVFVDRTAENLPPQVVAHMNHARGEPPTWEFGFTEGPKVYRCGAVPLREAGGREVGKILSLLDITQSVAAQNNLLTILIGSGAVLAGLLGVFFWGYLGWVQREVDRVHRELQVSLKREQSFADDVAHELRTPLAGIRSTIDVALAGEPSSDALRESLEDCSPIVKDMASLVGKLLMLARLDGRRITFHKETIRLPEFIDDCFEPMLDRAAARGLAFDNRVPSGLVCLSDRVSLGTVFSNLLENSVEYADENGRIWVTAGEDFHGAHYLAVANTGCSLEEEEAAMAFQQFWRAGGARDSEGRHVGLGLSLARRLATALGGDATAEVDREGVFTVRIVLEKASWT